MYVRSGPLPPRRLSEPHPLKSSQAAPSSISGVLASRASRRPRRPGVYRCLSLSFLTKLSFDGAPVDPAQRVSRKCVWVPVGPYLCAPRYFCASRGRALVYLRTRAQLARLDRPRSSAAVPPPPREEFVAWLGSLLPSRLGRARGLSGLRSLTLSLLASLWRPYFWAAHNITTPQFSTSSDCLGSRRRRREP